MIQGMTFNDQLFTAEAFAKYQNIFLNGNSGVIDGLALSNTTNSVTISDGWFCIKGRFLREQGGTTLTVSTNGYYSLICEIDLSKENTETTFNQASFKLLNSTDAYPTLTQQDINADGTLYQYELAKFRYNNTITDFVDKRTYLKFDSIYSDINAQSQALITNIKKDLQNVEDGSAYILNNRIALIDTSIDFTKSEYNYLNSDGTYTFENGIGTTGYIAYPSGFTYENCIVLSASILQSEGVEEHGMSGYFSGTNIDGTYTFGVGLKQSGIQIIVKNSLKFKPFNNKRFVRIVLLKVS